MMKSLMVIITLVIGGIGLFIDSKTLESFGMTAVKMTSIKTHADGEHQHRIGHRAADFGAQAHLRFFEIGEFQQNETRGYRSFRRLRSC